MQDNRLGRANGSGVAVSDHCIDFTNLENQKEILNSSMEKGGRQEEISMGKLVENGAQKVIPVVIYNGGSDNQSGVVPEAKGSKVFNGVSCNSNSAAVGSAVSNGDSCDCDSVVVNLEPKGSLASNGESYNSDLVLENGGGEGQSSLGESVENGAETVLTVVVSNGLEDNQFVATSEPSGSVVFNGEPCNFESIPVALEPRENLVKIASTKTNQVIGVSSAKKDSLSRSESFNDQCRVCQQSSEEVLIDLGCQCRGGLAKAHRSCIDAWFRTRGSNKCEICQLVATNVSPPESQPSRNYWVWRIDPTFRGSGLTPERERGCYSPLWVAFSILIGGLLLDVLISISLGVSALPVNIIIGVLVVLGLGTALRLALECCHELSLRRAVQRAETDINVGPLGYHPAV